MTSIAPVLMSIPEVCTYVGISRSQLWLLTKRGEFPEPVMLGARIKRWRTCDVDAFLAAGGTRSAVAGSA